MRRYRDLRHLPQLPPGPYTCTECGAVEDAATQHLDHLRTCSRHTYPYPALEQFRKDTPVPDWPTFHTYLCRKCGGVAKHHPKTRQLVGCVKCGYVTSAIATHFRYPERTQ